MTTREKAKAMSGGRTWAWRLAGGAAGLALAAALALAGPRAEAAGFFGTRSAGDYVPGEVLVKLRRGVPDQAAARVLAAAGSAVLKRLDARGLVHVKLPDGQTVADAIDALQQDPDVEYAQPNYIYKAMAVPNDTLYGDMWALKNTGQTVPATNHPYALHNPGVAGRDMAIEGAWDEITDCSSVVVAVLDSGIRYDHEDLAGNMWDGSAAGYPHHGFDYVDFDNDPMDANGHGTHVAGAIGAVGNNNTGTAGVCWQARLMAVRILDKFGLGSSSGVVQGMNFAVTHGAGVINMSLGGPQFDQALSDAVTSAAGAGVVVVVAAGNERKDNSLTPIYPCNFPQDNILCVAALDQAYALATFSNYSSTRVDVGAPGTNIVSEWAGTETVIRDDFNTGGALDWSTNNARWGHTVGTFSTSLGSRVFDALVDPPTWPNGSYTNNADDRVWKDFDLTGTDVAFAEFGAVFSLEPPFELFVFDYGYAGARRGGGDPFDSFGPIDIDFGFVTGSSGGKLLGFALDLAPCLGFTCSLGFQLLSDESITSRGIAIVDFSITKLAFDATSYNTVSGTSMATPHVSGLAAMLAAYNPDYTYLDIINAIEKGGTPTASLVGKTVTGKAVNAMGSLSYINAPTGVTAALE